MTLHSPILTLRLSRSITFFIASLIAYVWRMHLTVADFMPLTPQQALAPRISISAILGLGLLCLVLVIVLCLARPQAVSRAKPSPNRPGQAGPK
jgi:hypothetical protein